MNPSQPDLIYNGIMICLSLQLLLMGIFKIFSERRRDTALGLLFILMATSYFYNLYWLELKYNLLANVLFGGIKTVFYAPLIFLYVAMVKKQNNRRFAILHLTAPLIAHSLYLITKFGFVEFYKEHYSIVVNSIYLFDFLVSVVYFFMSIWLFKSLRSILIPKVLRGYQFAVFGFLLYQITTKLYGLITSFLMINISMDTYLSLSRYLFRPTYIIVLLSLLLFAFLESEKLKRWVFGKRIFTGYELVEKDEHIVAFIDLYFHQRKVFKESDFDWLQLLKENDIEERLFRLFLKKEYNKTPVDFLNDFRIEEFKRLLLEGNNAKYNLNGIAKQAGFNSRSSFYRNFKNKEGKTPKEYLEALSYE